MTELFSSYTSRLSFESKLFAREQAISDGRVKPAAGAGRRGYINGQEVVQGHELLATMGIHI